MALHPGDEAPWPDDAIEVGRILGAWGIKGGFRVQPFAADPQALFSSRRWFLRPALPAPGASPRPAPLPAAAARAAAARPAPLPGLLKITGARGQGDHVVATAQEVADRQAAEALKGARVFISRSSFPTPDDDEFYWVDLIGLAVANRDGLALGTVVGLIETGPHCVLRIQPPPTDSPDRPRADDPAEEILIPFVDAYVDQVDLPGRRLQVDWGADF